MKEVSESLRIIKVINEHLAESPECKHDLKMIMRQAIEIKNGLGNQPNPVNVDITNPEVQSRDDYER